MEEAAEAALAFAVVGRHATEHHEAGAHPGIISIEDGEDWAWCYEHEISIDLRSA